MCVCVFVCLFVYIHRLIAINNLFCASKQTPMHFMFPETIGKSCALFYSDAHQCFTFNFSMNYYGTSRHIRILHALSIILH